MSIDYNFHDWGETVCGSKRELQDLGIGLDKPFPGEPGGPKRVLNTFDPRGFRCAVKVGWGDFDFIASIAYPGRAFIPDYSSETFAPGVTIERRTHADCYAGTAESIVAAGIICPEYLPGAPGMNKHTATLLRDGTVKQSRKRVMHRDVLLKIHRVSPRWYEVEIMITSDEADFRRKKYDADLQEYRQRSSAMPRPAPLVSMRRAADAVTRRANLRLAWSRPVLGFSIHV